LSLFHVTSKPQQGIGDSSTILAKHSLRISVRTPREVCPQTPLASSIITMAIPV